MLAEIEKASDKFYVHSLPTAVSVSNAFGAVEVFIRRSILFIDDWHLGRTKTFNAKAGDKYSLSVVADNHVCFPPLYPGVVVVVVGPPARANINRTR